ncbi:MAG: hypothetical protein ACRDK2_02670 [Solirubrobacteraceae bacterium]
MPLTPGDLPKRGPASTTSASQPLLLVDIDGVISLFGFSASARPEGTFHWIDGIPHYLSATAAGHLLRLAERFELTWCSGWEERAEEYLPHLLGVPSGLGHLSFERNVGGLTCARAHWKLDAIDAYAHTRPLAWIDDAFNDACHQWAQTREAPTLLVQTAPEQGLTSTQVGALEDWVAELANLP